MRADLQFSQPVQDNFCSSMQFLQRTDNLAAALGCYLRDLPSKIGISERSMYGYRVGKYPVTAKALRKLEAAEKAAGIVTEKGHFVPHGTKLKGSDAETSTNPNEAEKGLNEIPALLSRIAASLEEIAAHLRKG